MSKKSKLEDKRYLIITIVAATVVISLSVYMFLEKQENVAYNYAEEIMTECEGKVDCVINALSYIAEREEQSVVLLTFQDLISKYDESLLYCHPQAHHLGMFLYDYISDLSEALSHADQQ